MAHVGQVGIDTNGFTWEAVCRAKAMLNGEAFDEHQVSLPWDHLAAYAFLDAALSDYGNFDSIAIESQTTSRWGVRIRLRSSPWNIVTANQQDEVTLSAVSREIQVHGSGLTRPSAL
ncbi:hypothetical protein F4823DRAFT_563663 [Ustulina deusta]|nr:hypothetical protein F4823DRAFT_563663 [Ustulina deusta]